MPGEPLFPLPVLDYTDRDLRSVRTRLINILRQVFPDWTDFDVATFGTMLLEAHGFVVDNLSYYQDNQANDAFLPTVQLRQNAIRLARRVGYGVRTASAATASVLFTLATVPSNDVTIPSGTVVRTKGADPVEFQLITDLTIPSGANPPQAFGDVEHSKDQQDVFSSDGRANQEFTLSATPFIDGTLTVTAANGAYTQATKNSFLDHDADDRVFVVVIDDDDRAKLKFGNGVNGEIPVGAVTIDYKTGGGKIGGAEANTITSIVGSFTDVLSNPVKVTVNNPVKASGGDDRESVEQIRINAPASLRVLERSISREDFEIVALKVPGIARALMLTSDDGLAIPENSGRLYVVPVGGGLPTSTLKQAVADKIDNDFPTSTTFNLTVVDPAYLTVDVRVVVFIRDGHTAAAVRNDIEESLKEFFQISNDDGTANTDIGFGFDYRKEDGSVEAEIPWSDVFNVIRDRPGVRKISDQPSGLTLNGLSRDVTIAVTQFPILGDVVVIDGTTGSQI